ncbi:MAG: acyl-CoA synthetase [Gammaproteobacteria bacterium]|nr:acyl-CoA synthetase [Gammaproteobacteria bacterium]MBI5615125.1 acyl-CoA synthetase [Gammaproteobacteria bacterium]
MSTGPESGAGGEPEWLRREERGTRFAVRCFVGLALGIGRPAARLLLPPICLYFLLFSPAARRASAHYLTRAFGRDATLRDVYRHYHSFASSVLDRVFLLKHGGAGFDVSIVGENVVTDILARGEGCILLGAHFGSFEVLRTVGRRQPQLHVNMVMFEENARKVNSVLNAIDPELAKNIIRLGRPDSFVTVERCLAAGHFVGVLADRSLSAERQVELPFLGSPARFSINPFRIISVLQKPVVFMVGIYRGGNRYEVHFETLDSADGERDPPRAKGVPPLLARYVERLEHYCRLAPYNWFNFYDFWS